MFSSTYKIYCGFILGNTTALLGACMSNQINNQFDAVHTVTASIIKL